MSPAGPHIDHLGHAVAGGLALVLTVVVLAVQRVRAVRAARDEQVPVAEPVPGPGAVLAPGLPAAARPASPFPAVGWLAVPILGAATVHAAATRVHFDESALLGSFFLLLSLTQFAYAAVIVLRPSRPLLQAGLTANLAVVGLWLYTRVVGIPFGVSGGGVERISVPDLLATGFELAAVVTAALLLRRPTEAVAGAQRPVLTPGQRLGAIFAVTLTSAVVASVGVS